MKTMLKKILIAGLLCAVVVLPLQAQVMGEKSTESMIELEKQKQENQKDIEVERIENDRKLAEAKIDAQRNMVHDLAWNSWVLFAIAAMLIGLVKNKRRHETIRLMIEKGTPITPEVLDGLRKKPRLGARNYDPQGYLCWGITEVFVGVALMIAFPSVAGARAAGWIVLAVGIANLILWFIDKAHSNGGQSN